MEQARIDEEWLRIGEVARLVGVSPSTIRAWEREGLVEPCRSDGRHRRYGPDDVEHLRRVRALLARGYRHRALRALVRGDDVPNEALAGARLRQARTRRGLSLRRAAALAGVSASYLSLVERGLAEPSVAFLRRVAAAYGGTLLEFFGSPEGSNDQKLVRVDERQRLRGFDRVVMENLVVRPGAQLQIQIFSVAPGGGSGGDYSHDGEEAIFVLEGEIDIWLDGSEYFRLGPGDTLSFPSTQLHRWSNPGSVVARLFWVNTPPTF